MFGCAGCIAVDEVACSLRLDCAANRAVPLPGKARSAVHFCRVVADKILHVDMPFYLHLRYGNVKDI